MVHFRNSNNLLRIPIYIFFKQNHRSSLPQHDNLDLLELKKIIIMRKNPTKQKELQWKINCRLCSSHVVNLVSCIVVEDLISHLKVIFESEIVIIIGTRSVSQEHSILASEKKTYKKCMFIKNLFINLPLFCTICLYGSFFSKKKKRIK